MWGRLSAAVDRLKQTSSNVGSAASRQVSAAAGIIKNAPDAVRGLRHAWTERVKPLEFSITPAELPHSVKSKAGIYLTTVVLLFLAASVVTFLGIWIFDQFANASLPGMLFSPVVVIIVAAGTYVSWLEFHSWRRLIAVEKIRADLAAATEQQKLRSALDRLATAVDEPHRTAIVDVVGATGATLSVAELRDLLDQRVFRQMDGYAIGAIHRSVRDMFFLSLVSPTDLTDTLAFVVRAAGMIRGIAFAYGQRPGRLGLIRLVRHVIADVALLSVTMIVMARVSKSLGGMVQSVTDHVGGLSTSAFAVGRPEVGVAAGAIKTVGTLAGAASETITDEIVDAAVTAARMAQLGLVAVAVVRPIELSEDRRKSMRQDLRKAILHMRREVARSRRELQQATEKEEEAEKVATK